MIRGFARVLDPTVSFDRPEGTTVQVNLSVESIRGAETETRVLLDIGQPFIRDLVQSRDERLFELLEELLTYATREIEES